MYGNNLFLQCALKLQYWVNFDLLYSLCTPRAVSQRTLRLRAVKKYRNRGERRENTRGEFTENSQTDALQNYTLTRIATR